MGEFHGPITEYSPDTMTAVGAHPANLEGFNPFTQARKYGPESFEAPRDGYAHRAPARVITKATFVGKSDPSRYSQKGATYRKIFDIPRELIDDIGSKISQDSCDDKDCRSKCLSYRTENLVHFYIAHPRLRSDYLQKILIKSLKSQKSFNLTKTPSKFPDLCIAAALLFQAATNEPLHQRSQCSIRSQGRELADMLSYDTSPTHIELFTLGVSASRRNLTFNHDLLDNMHSVTLTNIKLLGSAFLPEDIKTLISFNLNLSNIEIDLCPSNVRPRKGWYKVFDIMARQSCRGFHFQLKAFAFWIEVKSVTSQQGRVQYMGRNGREAMQWRCLAGVGGERYEPINCRLNHNPDIALTWLKEELNRGEAKLSRA
jgi:hypothetical protein